MTRRRPEHTRPRGEQLYERMVEALTQRRKDLGLSQREVAERLHVTQSTFCAYEQGRRRHSIPEVHAWARVVGLDMSVVFKPLPRREQPSRETP
jgi:transcriptional regulator with XRE-family HTH domain